MSRTFPKPENYLNRELSWLDFNERVLEEAEDPTVPLLERVKFLAIVSNNWDEFFMVRVAGIWRQIDAGITQPGPDGRTPRQVLEVLSRRIHDLAARQHRLFHQVIEPLLNAEGIFILKPEDLDEVQRDFTRDYFERNLLPLITPLAVDTGHPVPPPGQPGAGAHGRAGGGGVPGGGEPPGLGAGHHPRARPPARRGSCGCRRCPAGTSS